MRNRWEVFERAEPAACPRCIPLVTMVLVQLFEDFRQNKTQDIAGSTPRIRLPYFFCLPHNYNEAAKKSSEKQRFLPMQ
ncbi:hypothetical protein Y032_0157g3176 [Ancylostoma ceylanicum]|uniref:Uncharacterized protein n=1 Tax=Ancylostoma ceylanicum TaxID=53326 RepID=A0A016SZ90_9BILA|nr:hypothetical protein Y032_0157g3176 [Ancylostoma ceylanicum]